MRVIALSSSKSSIMLFSVTASLSWLNRGRTPERTASRPHAAFRCFQSRHRVALRCSVGLGVRSIGLLYGNTWPHKLIGFSDRFYLHKRGFRCERSDTNTGYCCT